MVHQTFSLQDILTSMKEPPRMIQMILGGIGARLTDIRKLFLIEAALIGFSTLIGIVAGYSPARRAMKLSALEVIRNE